MSSIHDVAKHAGVAISTVSKVLNHYPGVSEETKDKVNKAIEELQFVPNTLAAALSSKQSARIALLLNLNSQTQAIDEIDMQYLSGAINEARKRNMDVITLFFSMLKEKKAPEIINYLKAQSIHGLIIYGISREDEQLHAVIESEAFKTVVVDSPIVNRSVSSVWIDQEQAQYDVAKKTILENENCHKILYLSGKENGYIMEGRMKGIRRLCEELDLSLTIKNGEFSEKKARELTFHYGKDADVIVCASDFMAIGAMRALIEMDVFHPVCGFDGIRLMGYAGKQMHTVRQNFSEISAQAVREVQHLMEGGQGRNLILPHELVRLKYEDIIC